VTTTASAPRRAPRPARPAGPAPAPGHRAKLLAGGLVVAIAAVAVTVAIRTWPRGARAAPAEVRRIASGLAGAGHVVDRVARNSQGGWSVLFDDGEVQWFRAPSHREAVLHPIRVMHGMRRDPNVVVLELHPTVFVLVLSGRRQGSTLELGTARTSAAEIAERVRTAVQRAR